MGEMGRLWVLSLVLLAVVSSSPVARGQGPAVATATATATASSTATASAGSGSSASASATADAEDGSSATAVSEADAENGGTAVSDVTATAKNGSTVIAAGKVHASDGAYVNGTVNLKAEDGAVAVFKLLLAASGNKALAVEVWGEGLRTYEGNVIALTLWKSFQESPEMGFFYTDALAVACGDFIKEYPDKPDKIAPIIVSAIRQKGPAADYFGGVLIKLYEVEGCGFVRPAYIAAEKLATSKYLDKPFIIAIDESPELISCIYSITCDEVVENLCCSNAAQADGRCYCVGGKCNYKLFWEDGNVIWKCTADACTRKSKCSCPANS